MAASLSFLLEIGVEEVPDWMMPDALAYLKTSFGKLLEEHRLSGAVDWVDGTPRRLALMASGLPTGQADSEEVLNGPPKSAGQGAAQGFARKNGATADQLEVLVTPKGEYFALRRKVAGQPTGQILAAKLPELILGIPWPKAMYWGAKGSPRFIRPIRWIVALLDDSVVAFDAAGVTSGNLTQGHRTAAGREAGQQKVPVTISTYESALRSSHVLVRAAERRSRITQGCADLLAGKDLVVKPDADLVETLTFITEWPTPILGSFAEEYLTLPAEVLVTVMRHHQKYFSVNRPDGSLAPHFIAVMNSAADPDGWIQSGNQRVLRARFNDARFFWEMDQHTLLRDRVESLANVTFQAKLGSYLDKTKRVQALVRELGGNENAERAALLAKTDLTTEMVKEFTELQGVVGGLYARAQGEPEEVTLAIYDHYKPVSMEGEIPGTVSGQIVSLADKLDTLRECFRIGMVPSGSKDPFALRRAAQGVLRILAEGDINASLAELCAGDATLIEFFADRVRYYFREIRGYRYDEVNAAMAAGWNDVKDLSARLEALKAVRGSENFEPLAASFKRVGNILTQAGFTGGAIDAALLSDDAERELHRAMTSLDLSGVSYQTALERIASLRPHVDFFFDKVLVNAPDPAVRTNRLALLYYLRSEFSRIADFSEITTS